MTFLSAKSDRCYPVSLAKGGIRRTATGNAIGSLCSYNVISLNSVTIGTGSVGERILGIGISATFCGIVRRCSFLRMGCTEISGAAIYFEWGALFEMSDCRFSECIANGESFGGAVFVWYIH
jgi:hypothetical protein